MKNILVNVKYQFAVFCKSKHILAFLICSLILVFMFSFGQFKQLESNLDNYDKSIKFYAEIGLTEEEALNLENDKEIIKKDNIELVEQNTLTLSKNEVTMTLYTLNSYYFLQNILEGAIFLFFPIILIVYAIYMSSQEYDNKVIRIRALNSNWGATMLSKLFFASLVSMIFILFTSILAYVVSIIQFQFIDNDILTKFMNNDLMVDYNLTLNVLIAMLVSIIFVCLSVMIVTITKNKFLTLVSLFIYLLVIPSLGMFDLKNILMNLAFSYYPYNGTSTLAKIIDLQDIFCFSVCFVVILISMLVTYKVAKKQSKY